MLMREIFENDTVFYTWLRKSYLTENRDILMAQIFVDKVKLENGESKNKIWLNLPFINTTLEFTHPLKKEDFINRLKKEVNALDEFYERMFYLVSNRVNPYINNNRLA